MAIHVHRTDDSVKILADDFQIIWAKDHDQWRDMLQIKSQAGWKTIASTSWHLLLRKPNMLNETHFFSKLELMRQNGESVELNAFLEVSNFGKMTVHYEVLANGLINITTELYIASEELSQVGLEFLRFQRHSAYERVRLYDLIPSGWSNENGAVVFSSDFCTDYPGEQMGLAYLDTPNPKDQGIGLRYPPCYANGYTRILPGTIISGNLRVYLNDQDLWGPNIAIAPQITYQPPTTIATPRYNYSEYIDHWCNFIGNPELWIDLGDEMGMFHRGYYGMFGCQDSRIRVSGVLRCEKTATGDLKFQTEDDRLVELAWGGSANVMMAETMTLLSRRGLVPEGERLARQIVKAVLHFQDGAFQVGGGPCRGAWWNCYIFEKDCFASRYGRAHVEMPNQGIINYFLYRLQKLGVVDDPTLCERIIHNCSSFLTAMARSDGGVDFARYIDGQRGEDRHYLPYETCFASGCALAALSWLCSWRITGKKEFKDQAKKLFDHVVNDHIQHNNWRFLEYDTSGTDTAGISWILIALCEALKDFDIPTWHESAEKTFSLLWSLIHHEEPMLDRYLAKEYCWFGSMRIKGGIVHGSSANSNQGSHIVHIRYDFPLAFQLYYELSKDVRAYVALTEYLNFMTWHQFLRKDIPLSYGATSEGCSLDADYLQDTAQVKHSNPLVMLGLLDQLQLIGTNMNLLELYRPESQTLLIRVQPKNNHPGWLAFNLPVIVKQSGRILYQGCGSRVIIKDMQDAPLEVVSGQNSY